MDIEKFYQSLQDTFDYDEHNVILDPNDFNFTELMEYFPDFFFRLSSLTPKMQVLLIYQQIVPCIELIIDEIDIGTFLVWKDNLATYKGTKHLSIEDHENENLSIVKI